MDCTKNNPRASIHLLSIIVILLRESEPVSISDIAEKLTGNRETTGPKRSIKNLIDVGYIEIYEPPVRIGKDSPKKLVRLTEKALRRLDIKEI